MTYLACANWRRLIKRHRLNLWRGPLLAMIMLWLVFGLLARAWGAAEPPRIMLLVSYNAGMAWSDDQISGVRTQLQSFLPEVNLQLDFLDTKQTEPSPQYYQRLEELLRIKYGTAPPQLILATDDDALDFALGMRQRHYPGIPILFSGVAASRRSALSAEPNISGVFDDADVAQSLVMMLHLLPATKRLVVVHDQSRTSLAQVETLRQAATQLNGIKIEFLTKLNVAAIQARLHALDRGDIVLALAFNRDIDGRILTHEAASDLWAAAATVPVAVTRDVSMRPGILGGYLITGKQQGTTMGQMALQVLNGTPAATLPMRDGAGIPTFDFQQLQRWTISENSLPINSVVLNRPVSSWASLRPHLAWLGSLFGGMTVIIGLLINGIRVRRISEAALRQSAQNYRELFDSSNDAIIVRDTPTGNIVDTNKRFQNLYGYLSSEALQLRASDISLDQSPLTNSEIDRLMKKTLDEGPQFFEWRSRRKDGSVFWSEVSMTCFNLPEGQRIVSTIRDISDRKLAQSQVQEFEHQVNQIYQNLPVAVFAIDAAHKLTFWNPQMALLTGIAASEIVGSAESWRGGYSSPRPSLADMVVDGLHGHALEHLFADKLRSSTILKGAVEGEDFFPKLNQAQGMWLRFCAAPLFDANGVIIGAIETIIDVTELKQSQLDLTELNLQLEARVEARTQDLKKAMGQLLQAEKMVALGSLVAGVAHELNTPIGNILTTASALKEFADEFDEKLQSGTARRSEIVEKIKSLHEASTLIERNALRAGKLVSDFKEVAVGQNSSRKSHFKLIDVVTGVMTTMAPLLKQTTHQLNIDIAPEIEMHSYIQPLEQILHNLLFNSLHHAFDGRQSGTINIRAFREGEKVILEYSDDGCGISETSLTRLFDPFFTTKLGQGGSGLGLYIVYNLVAGVLGGEINVDSAPQQGMKFSLRLPLISSTTP